MTVMSKQWVIHQLGYYLMAHSPVVDVVGCTAMMSWWLKDRCTPHSLLEYCWMTRLSGFVHPNIWTNPCSKRRLRWRETLCSAQCCHIARNGCFNTSKTSAPCFLAKAAMPVTHFWGIVCFCWQFVSALLWKQLNLSCCSCRALTLSTVPLSFQAI